MLYPLLFEPIYKERIWGGTRLQELYGKDLPADTSIGESWEISDRPGDVSVVANGPLKGKNLRWLMDNHGAELLGSSPSQNGRFPLLVKILDAREKLSLQVHPPRARARELGGEPKTEMWYVASAGTDSALYVGLKRGVTKEEFTKQVHEGTVEQCFHRVTVHEGDSMFLPSGRVHALGAGLVIFEIQQNSDTTYRVFDWNRKGLDGRPRELHVEQSLQSIDFTDFEPPVNRPDSSSKLQVLVRDALFNADLLRLGTTETHGFKSGTMRIIGLTKGAAVIRTSDAAPVGLSPGQFALVPAICKAVAIEGVQRSELLVVEGGTEV